MQGLYGSLIKQDKEAMTLDSDVFRYFFDKSTIGIKILDTEGCIIYANEAELSLFGVNESDFIGHHFSEFLPDQEKAKAFFEYIKGLDSVEGFSTQLLRTDGSVIDVMVDVSVNCNKNELESVCCFTRDISLYKRNSDLLEYLNVAGHALSSTYDTESALNKISELIVPRFANWFCIDLLHNGKVELLKIFHENPEYISIAANHRAHHPVTLEDDFGAGKVLRTGHLSFTPVVDELLLNRVFPGPQYQEVLKVLSPQSVIVVPMHVHDTITGAITFISTEEGKYYEISDLSFAQEFANRIGLALENARLYEEAQFEIQQRIEAERKKDEFISMASHELKTPLTSIKAYTQILGKKLEPDSNTISFVHKAAGHVNQLERLISDLLDVSKINAGKLTYNLSIFDFNQALEESVESVQNLTSTHRIEIAESVSVFFRGDKLRIEQVIINFLTNAIKYSPNADKVVVRARIDANNIVVSVQDFGIGIEKENLHKLFERFYRVDTASMKYSGLGLGLFIAAEILQGHNGSFWIESELNKGSIFYFRLPLNLSTPEEVISTNELYQDSFLRVEFNKEEQWLEAKWSGFQTYPSILKGGEVILRLLAENECSKILNDNSEVLGNWAEAADEGREVWFPAMEKAGLRYFAWVESASTFGKLVSQRSINPQVGNVQVHFFQKAAEAKEWLRKFP